jgi:hypothetical protein
MFPIRRRLFTCVLLYNIQKCNICTYICTVVHTALWVVVVIAVPTHIVFLQIYVGQPFFGLSIKRTPLPHLCL